MTIRTKFLLMLLFLSLLMGVGIIIPGFLKLRELELDEAREYALERSARMTNQVGHSIDILEKAGVAEIDSYISESKEKLIERFKLEDRDPRVNQYIFDKEGNILFDGSSKIPMPITAELITKLSVRKSNSMQHAVGANKWLLTFEKHDNWDWYLVASMAEQEVYVDSRDYLIYVITISGLVLLFVISLYILLTRQLSRRTRNIMNHLEMFKAGRYDKRFKVTGNDEFSILQNSINSMIDSIEIEIESRKTAEKELINLSKIHTHEFEQGNTNLLSNISVNSKDPINVIQGFSNLLASSKVNKKQASYARSIIQASQILDRQLNNTLGNTSASNKKNTDDEADIQVLCHSLKNLEVVISDDDPLNKDYISEVLQQCKIKSTMIDDDKQLITHLENNDTDLILLDMAITGFSAEKTIQQIRAKRQSYLNDIPIIALTSNLSDDEKKNFMKIGATATIDKPFTPAHLLAEIGRIIDAQ